MESCQFGLCGEGGQGVAVPWERDSFESLDRAVTSLIGPCLRPANDIDCVPLGVVAWIVSLVIVADCVA